MVEEELGITEQLRTSYAVEYGIDPPDRELGSNWWIQAPPFFEWQTGYGKVWQWDMAMGRTGRMGNPGTPTRVNIGV